MKKWNAYKVGEQTAIQNVKLYESAEELIFDAMKSNPYKSEQSRKDYIEGVSSWVNLHYARLNRSMNEKAQA